MGLWSYSKLGPWVNYQENKLVDEPAMDGERRTEVGRLVEERELVGWRTVWQI